MRTILISTIIFLTACSSYNKYERRAKRGDVNACDLLVHLLEEKMQFEGKNQKIEDKIYKYSTLCIKLDTANWYKGYHYLQLAKSKKTSESNAYLYYYKAAQLDEGEGQFITAISFLDGRHQKMNKDSALYWYIRATKSQSIYTLHAYKAAADMLYEGKYVKPDTIMALYYYKKACSCCDKAGDLASCDTIINYYRKQKLKDTTEIMIYTDFATPLRGRMNYK